VLDMALRAPCPLISTPRALRRGCHVAQSGHDPIQATIEHFFLLRKADPEVTNAAGARLEARIDDHAGFVLQGEGDFFIASIDPDHAREYVGGTAGRYDAQEVGLPKALDDLVSQRLILLDALRYQFLILSEPVG